MSTELPDASTSERGEQEAPLTPAPSRLSATVRFGALKLALGAGLAVLGLGLGGVVVSVGIGDAGLGGSPSLAAGESLALIGVALGVSAVGAFLCIRGWHQLRAG
jgi:hypothetical protein